MTEFAKFAPGQFSWVDLMTPNAEEAKRFYGELFGWDVIENPTDQGGVYTQFTLRDRHVAGMGEQSEEMKQAAVPAFWNSYVTVDNVDASAERAATLGGQLTMPVMQVMDAGRMAIIADPTGAQLSIWEPLEHIGAGIGNESDSFCWNELATA